MTLIDTSAWIEALRSDGRHEVRSQVAGLLETGQAALCPMVTLELWNGAGGEAERAKLRRLTENLPSYEITHAAWARAVELATTARSKGVTVPATDIVIAATAAVHNLGLLHSDRHFDALHGLE